MFSLPLQQPVAIFLLVLVMILVTPLLLRRLGIPHIVGMIMAGVVVGPYGCNILARDASFEIFGQVGILYLMFLAGVEIDMVNLRRNWKTGVGFGLLSFFLPSLGAVLVCRYVLDMSWLTTGLIASMLGSHTLISYPIAARFGLTNIKSSVVAVCGTIVAVLLSLILLAQVVSVKTDGSAHIDSILRLFLWLAIYALVIWYLLSYATKWFFRKYADRVTQYIFILAEVLLASLLAQMIGLEAILGAFYAGLVLNRFVPSRSGLMTRIEFVGNAIFIPYFLIGVGMLINVHVIFSGFDIIKLALIITVVGLLTKWIAAWLAQRYMKTGRRERMLIFGLTSGKAAATIAATMIGYRYGIISVDVMNAAVIMILLCCTIASVTTEMAAKRIRMQMAHERINEEGTAKVERARQLVAVANPLTAEGIMKMAMYMRHPANSNPVTALFIRSTDDTTKVSMGKEALREATRSAASVDVAVEEVERYDVNIVAGLTNALKERNCTEILIGLHRKTNIVDSFYGSMTENLLASTNKMVIMSRCFVPVNTLSKIVVIVPENAEYETGFALWVTRICMLCEQVGGNIHFMAYTSTIPYLQAVVAQTDVNLLTRYEAIQGWDDFITSSSIIGEDDLLTIIGARRTSISFNTEWEGLPSFLGKYYSRQNLLIVFPEQFGPEVQLPDPLDTLSSTIMSSPSSSEWRKWFWPKKIKD